MKIVFYVILGLFAFFLLSLLGLKHYQFFAPKYENVRREVFINTRSYNEGKVQDLEKYRLEYLRSKDEVEREALKSTILMVFADYSEEKLPPHLREFLTDLRAEVL